MSILGIGSEVKFSITTLPFARHPMVPAGRLTHKVGINEGTVGWLVGWLVRDGSNLDRSLLLLLLRSGRRARGRSFSALKKSGKLPESFSHRGPTIYLLPTVPAVPTTNPQPTYSNEHGIHLTSSNDSDDRMKNSFIHTKINEVTNSVRIK